VSDHADHPPRRWLPRAGALYLASFVACLLAGWLIGVIANIDRQVDPDSLDVHILNWVRIHRQGLPGFTKLMLAITRLGNGDVGTGMVLLSAVIFGVWEWQHRPGIRRGDWGFWILVNLGARLLTVAIKALFQRPRPPLIDRLVTETSFSFPSGHSVSTAAFFTVWVVFFWRAARSDAPWVRFAFAICAVVMILAIGGSRIWLTVHYFTDVVSGLVLGMTWASLCCFVHYKHHPRRKPGDPVDHLDAGSESALR
jgi:undecaprenyl-diphosphatase